MKPDQVARDRYLFYTACTRATRRLYLVREAATDDGTPREPSPFWDEVPACFPPTTCVARRRAGRCRRSRWPIDEAPTARERLRALAALAAADAEDAGALALANGWERRLDRALAAFERPTELRHPLVLECLGERTSFNVTELERFFDCSSAWFVDRLLDPRTIDAEADPKLRGSVAHNALHKFFSGIPKELGVERLEATGSSALAVPPPLPRPGGGGRAHGADRAPAAGARPDALARPRGIRPHRGASELPLVPSRYEVSFGAERSAPLGGLDLGDGLVSGKIDRVDVETHGARGIVQDYKSGRLAHSAQQITQEQRLQIPLYMLVLRDLVGIEPLGGLYRAAGGGAAARAGCCARGARRAAGLRTERLPRRRGSGRARDGAGRRTLARAADPRRRRAARPAATALPVVVRPLAGVPGERARERRAAGGGRRERARLRLGGSRNGKDARARRALRARGLRRRPRRRVDPRHHVHAACRG